MQYHPDDITRRQIRAEWDKHCGKLFEEELGLTQQVIVAYSRQKNIRDYVSQAALHQADGRTSSTALTLLNETSDVLLIYPGLLVDEPPPEDAYE